MLALDHWKLIPVLIAITVALAISTSGCAGGEPEQKIFDLSIQHKTLKESSILSAKQDDNVILNITSDEKALFHLHGYDLDIDLEPNIVSKLSFKANATGKFDFEMHLEAHTGTHSHDHKEKDANKIQLGSLEVHPR